jgi:hypothetical protein
MLRPHDRTSPIGADQGERMVSASEIARLAYCERQIRFDVLRGRRTSESQRAARLRGEVAHRAFYEESRGLADRSARRGKCFIATLALGETPQTLALRQFRDVFLRRSVWGRAFIAMYYRYSPIACGALAPRPHLLLLIRGPLRVLALAAAIAVHMRLRKERSHGA